MQWSEFLKHRRGCQKPLLNPWVQLREIGIDSFFLELRGDARAGMLRWSSSNFQGPGLRAALSGTGWVGCTQCIEQQKPVWKHCRLLLVWEGPRPSTGSMNKSSVKTPPSIFLSGPFPGMWVLAPLVPFIQRVQEYLARKKLTPTQGHHRALGMGLL